MLNVLNEWNEVLLEAIRQTKPGPPIVARSIAIVYTSVYDAWAAYDPVAKPTQPGIPQRPSAENTSPNKETAIHYAAFRALADQFSAARSLFVDRMVSLGLDPTNNSMALNTPIGIGNKAASIVLTFRQTDGANEAGNYADTSGYVSVNPPLNPLFPSTVDDIPHPDRWQKLVYLTSEGRPASPDFIAPHWGNVIPFALTSGSQFRPGQPEPLTSQGFLDQAKHIIEVQANLTPIQQVIAEYWADGPRSELPPGHWMIFTAFVANRDHLDLDASVKLFFAVSNAIFDASIATWEAKRFYDYCRPITAIRHLFRGKTIRAWGGAGRGTIDIQGENWRTFQVNTFPTPPFAEYTSGHSAFSMAAAEVLRRFTGSDTFGYFYLQTRPLSADPSVDVIGLAMRWSSFTQAALEAGESRLYGGIHFYEGNTSGLQLGRQVGEQAFQKAQHYWTGTI
ncbi:vanadium-dependent haloperoxidase [Spirosoma taeanense]|uniref:Vanadium-dependent haloperoxidase n=1 Tax=Spirosoma taeanense TaxID=2735870 RepID=A0A6M5Y9K7_9BACT|nr:vanadium-dependent haloperoxidase [Spirosoma taeanense]QJW90046.1 vanadium-dependent haloperoxidase [Spirosoma taeanense]